MRLADIERPESGKLKITLIAQDSNIRAFAERFKEGGEGCRQIAVNPNNQTAEVSSKHVREVVDMCRRAKYAVRLHMYYLETEVICTRSCAEARSDTSDQCVCCCGSAGHAHGLGSIVEDGMLLDVRRDMNVYGFNPIPMPRRFDGTTARSVFETAFDDCENRVIYGYRDPVTSELTIISSLEGLRIDPGLLGQYGVNPFPIH